MMKAIKLASILIIVVVILLGTFSLASSVGVVPWFQISDTPALQGYPESPIIQPPTSSWSSGRTTGVMLGLDRTFTPRS